MGKLVFDDAAFDKAIAADPCRSSACWAITGADDEIKHIKDSLTRFDDKMDLREQRYRAQFTALEQAMSRSQSIQADLAQRLAALGQ